MAVTKRRKFTIALALTCLAACAHNNEVAEISTHVALVPAVGSYWGYSQTKELYQNSLISVGLPDFLYAEEVSPGELDNYRRAGGDPTFPNTFAYIGSRDGFHYFSWEPFLESRRILKVREEQYRVARVRPLSSAGAERWGGPYLLNLEHFNEIDLGDIDLGAADPEKGEIGVIVPWGVSPFGPAGGTAASGTGGRRSP